MTQQTKNRTTSRRRRGRRTKTGRDTDGQPASQARRVEERAPAPSSTDDRLMIINVAEGDETRIAIAQGGRLEEFFIERHSSESHVNNIYKGRVTNLEPSIQAAFVDFGAGKNGFLHISDLHPQYFPDSQSVAEEVGKKIPRKDRPPIQKCLRRGQEVIVQVQKEGIGTKGPTLTTYITLSGRYLVMMPGMTKVGISRKIEDEDTRRRMRDVLNELNLPKGMGFILRTAGVDQSKRELQRDLNYLLRLWKQIAQRIKTEPAPAELHRESDLVIRTIRDVYTNDISRIIVDDEETANRAREFLSIVMPRSQGVVEYYDGPEPIFHHFGIESEVQKIHARRVPLPCGGSLVIESTEALVAIDVNSGTFRAQDNAEEAALQVDLEAAEEIARQLRLRDLGGVIICDFIDVRLDKNRRKIERALRDALKKHKERARILRMSQFGVIEITRQRQRPSVIRSLFTDCPHCHGSGQVKTAESMALDVLRLVKLASIRPEVAQIEARVHPDVATLLLNRKRRLLNDLEARTGRAVVIVPDASRGLDEATINLLDARGCSVPFEEGQLPPPA